jgi:acyl carrier protein
MPGVTQEQVVADLVSILGDMTSDWDLDQFSGGIGPDTRLVADLSFESIEVVQLLVAIEKRFGLKNLAFDKLLVRNGQAVTDLTVDEIARFLIAEIPTS